MTLSRHVAVLVAVLAVGSCVNLVAASDDDSEPLYVIHHGQRIPTVIIPPRASGTSSPAFEVVQSEPQPAPRAEDGEQFEPDQVAPSGADQPPSQPSVRREVTGRYAGYPVSYYNEPGYPDWGYGYYQPDVGQRIRDVYEAEHWAREQERQYRFNARDMRQRRQRVLASHEKALRSGLEYLNQGNYSKAVVALQMAAELNQGDPACRIHLAQARLALGHYEEGGRVLRRALQLQSKLVYVSLDLPSYYPNPTDFDAQVDKFAAWVKERRAGADKAGALSADTYLLLGFMEFQRDRLTPAYEAFRAAAAAKPKDEIAAAYLKITRPPR